MNANIPKNLLNFENLKSFSETGVDQNTGRQTVLSIEDAQTDMNVVRSRFASRLRSGQGLSGVELVSIEDVTE